MILSKSAGGVVHDGVGNVVVVNQDGVSWSLPKGHVEDGESLRETALREIEEETGLTSISYEKDLGAYERCKISKEGNGEDCNFKKHITLFLYRSEHVPLIPQDPANPEARWVPKEEVAALLSHPKDKEFFLSILPLIP